MPRASSRSSASACSSSSAAPASSWSAPSGSSRNRAWASRSASESETRRCWAPSWRLRSRRCGRRPPPRRCATGKRALGLLGVSLGHVRSADDDLPLKAPSGRRHQRDDAPVARLADPGGLVLGAHAGFHLLLERPPGPALLSSAARQVPENWHRPPPRRAAQLGEGVLTTSTATVPSRSTATSRLGVARATTASRAGPSAPRAGRSARSVLPPISSTFPSPPTTRRPRLDHEPPAVSGLPLCPALDLGLARVHARAVAPAVGRCCRGGTLPPQPSAHALVVGVPTAPPSCR